MEADRRSLSFRLLGPFEAHRGPVPLPIPAGKLRALLAALVLVRPGGVVGVAELLDAGWGDRPARNERAALQSSVLRLRRLLGDADGTVLETAPDGYRLRVGAGGSDVDRFRSLLGQATAARERGSDPEESTLLRAALDLWRGPALADVPSDSLRRDVGSALEQERLAALDRRIDLDLARGAGAELVTELVALTGGHPLRERTWARLALAQYRAGRRTDALDTCRRAAGTLRAELGVDPGPELRDLHARILKGAPPPDADRPAVAVRPVFGLPAGPPDFVGRDGPVGEIRELLTAPGASPVVVVGPPGVGKSALAVHAAHGLRGRFPDGQWYVDLRGARDPRDPADALRELLETSGVPAPAVPAGTEARSRLLRQRLDDRRVLVVLDDAADAAQVAALLPGGGGSRVLVTSRYLLEELPGAHRVRLGPFTDEEVGALLSTLIGARRVAREPAAVRELGHRCGHNPLAVRIVGARLTVLPDLPVAVLADRLADERGRLDELTSGALAVRAGVDISYRALDEPGRAAFRRLGLPQTPEVPAWLLGALADGDGQRLAEQLLRASLLQPTGRDLLGEPRYRLHDLLHLYARELVAQEPAQQRAAARHRVLDLLVAGAELVAVREPASALDLPPEPPVIAAPAAAPAGAQAGHRWLLAHRDHLLEAITDAARSGRHADAARLADLVMAPLELHGGLTEIRAAAREVAAAAHRAGDEHRALRADYRLAYLTATEDIAAAERMFADCVAGFERGGPSRALVFALTGRAIMLMQRGDLDGAARSAGRAVEVAEQAADDLALATALRQLGGAERAAGRHDRAVRLVERALSLVPDDQPLSLAQGGAAVAEARLAAGDLPGAEQASLLALDAAGRSGNPTCLAWTTVVAARVSQAAGRHAEALDRGLTGRRLMQENGDLRGEGTALMLLGSAGLALEDPGRAADCAGAAVRIFDDLGAAPAAQAARVLLDAARTRLAAAREPDRGA